MNFWRFFTGVFGVLLFLSIPVMLITGIIFLIFNTSIILIIIGLFLYLLISVYMVWWGFIEKEQTKNSETDSPSPLQIIALLVIAVMIIVLLSTIIHVTYRTIGVSGFDLVCDKSRNVATNDPGGNGIASANNQGASQCRDFETSEYKLECKNNRVVIACKATIWNAYISKKS